MTKDELLEECESELRKICFAVDDGMPQLARTLAWRMYNRIEEMRLRHPVSP